MPPFDATPAVDLSERPLRFPVVAAPAVVREELGRLYAEHDRQIDALLVELALVRFHLERSRVEAVHEAATLTQEALETLGLQLDKQLAEHDVRMDDLTGREWLPEWADSVKLRGFVRNDELPRAVVTHVERPLVYRGGRLIATGIATLAGPRRD